MRITVAAFADDAKQGSDQKLSIHGIHNAVKVADLPARLTEKLVLRFTAEPEDAGREQRVTLRVLRPDGTELTTITADPFSLDVAPQHPADLDQVLDLSILAEAAGRYTFDIEVNGTLATRLPLLVLHDPNLVVVGNTAGKLKPKLPPPRRRR
jgi:hypothetical protein